MHIGIALQSFGITSSDGIIGGNMAVGAGAFVGVGGSFASQQVVTSHFGLGGYYVGAGETVFIGIPQYRSQVANFQVCDTGFRLMHGLITILVLITDVLPYYRHHRNYYC